MRMFSYASTAGINKIYQMCKHSLLAHSTSGYFILCKECGNFQFAFGTMEVVMDRSELAEFQHYLSAQKYPVDEPGALHRKTIRVALHGSRAAFALTPFEAKELMDLLNEGMATYEVNNLLCEFR